MRLTKNGSHRAGLFRASARALGKSPACSATVCYENYLYLYR